MNLNIMALEVAHRLEIPPPGGGLSIGGKPDDSAHELGGGSIVSKLFKPVIVLEFISPELHGAIVLGPNTPGLKSYLDQVFALSVCSVPLLRGSYLSPDLERPSSRPGLIARRRHCVTLQAILSAHDISIARFRVQHVSRFPAGEQHAARDRRAHSPTRVPTRAHAWSCVRLASLLRAHDGPAVKLIASLFMATLAGCMPLLPNCLSVTIERYGMEYEVHATDCRLPFAIPLPR